MLARESAWLGMDPASVIPEESGSSARERYAPMHRLLAPDDELFLAAQGFPSIAKRLRREHRSCYFGYVARLAKELRHARRLHNLAMASREQWHFPLLLAQVVIAESSLLYLRWLGCQHALGINSAARDVQECLDFLLAAPQFQPATS